MNSITIKSASSGKHGLYGVMVDWEHTLKFTNRKKANAFRAGLMRELNRRMDEINMIYVAVSSAAQTEIRNIPDFGRRLLIDTRRQYDEVLSWVLGGRKRDCSTVLARLRALVGHVLAMADVILDIEKLAYSGLAKTLVIQKNMLAQIQTQLSPLKMIERAKMKE